MTATLENTGQKTRLLSLPALMIGSIILGSGIRMGLAAISLGTNDADTWLDIAKLVRDHGLIEAYRLSDALNHPPAPVLWSRLALMIAGTGQWFSFLMKIPAIVGDALTLVLAANIWMARQDSRRARLTALTMALSPVGIIISGYHCNTDNLYAAMSLLVMFILTERANFFLGGLALAAAINVKLVPIILIPPALSLCQNWRDAKKLIGGLSLGVIPFLPLILTAPQAVWRNMMSYNPPIYQWGMTLLLHDVSDFPALHGIMLEIMRHYYLWIGRCAIIAGVGILSVISWRTRRWNGYEMGFLCYGLLLVLAPGFGHQYTIFVVPMLLAISLGRSWVYGAFTGVFLVLSYFSRLVPPTFPLHTIFVRGQPMPPGTTFGLLAWWVLLDLMLQMTIGRRVWKTDERASSAGLSGSPDSSI